LLALEITKPPGHALATTSSGPASSTSFCIEFPPDCTHHVTIVFIANTQALFRKQPLPLSLKITLYYIMSSSPLSSSRGSSLFGDQASPTAPMESQDRINSSQGEPTIPGTPSSEDTTIILTPDPISSETIFGSPFHTPSGSSEELPVFRTTHSEHSDTGSPLRTPSAASETQSPPRMPSSPPRMPSEDSETRSPPRTLLPSSAFGSPVHTPSAGSVSSSATITPENPKPRRAKGLDLNRPPHVPTMDPAQRQNAETKWRHGVLNAGRVIDMLETLSRTKYEYDQEVV
jgi:hypothetical protein